MDSLSEITFAVIGGAAFVLLLASFVFGEIFDFFGSDADIGGIDTDADGVSWLSTKVLFAGLVGFGTFGLVASQYDLPQGLVWLIAVLGFALVSAGVFYMVLLPLSRQQSNSSLSRTSYEGLQAVVTLAVSPGSSGIVTFHDSNGAFVSETAYLADGEEHALPKGAQVAIVSVNPRSVVVTPHFYS